MREQRYFPRANAVLPVKLWFYDHATRRVINEAEGQTTDIGNGGIGLVLRRQLPSTLPTGTLQLTTFPNRAPIQLEVRVVWLTPISGDGRYRCGFQIVNINDEQLREITEFLATKIDDIIRESTKHIIETAPNSSIRDLVSKFFTVDVKSYLADIVGTYEYLKCGQIGEDQGIKKISGSFDDIARKADRLEDALRDKLISSEVKKAFRLIVGAWVYQSRLIKHAFEKPRGYPGDYALLEHVYDKQPMSPHDELGYCFDRHFLQDAYAESVRNRKEKMRQMLKVRLQGKNSPINMLNLACGACREIRELITEDSSFAKKIFLTALDQDQEALDFTRQHLQKIAPELSVRFVAEDVVNLIKDPAKYTQLLGKQHLIYSIGLADYLPDRVLKRLVDVCLKLLRPGGQLIIAHKDRYKDNQAPVQPDWFCDWKFAHRSETDIVKLVREVSTYPLELEREKTGRIFFAVVTARNNG